MKVVKGGESTKEVFLPAFLAETAEEAQSIYDEFSALLNYTAYSWCRATGLDKGDLFSEGLVGLARAKRDFEPDRSTDFKVFAVYKIRDAMSEYTRKFSSTVVIPSYLSKAKRSMERLKQCLLNNNVPEDIFDMFFHSAMLNGDSLKKNSHYISYMPCELHVNVIKSAADRASITYVEMIRRLYALPSFVDYEHEVACEDDHTSSDLRDLRSKLDDEEQSIFDGFLEGLTFQEIGDMHGRGASWAFRRFNAMKEKLKSLS